MSPRARRKANRQALASPTQLGRWYSCCISAPQLHRSGNFSWRSLNWVSASTPGYSSTLALSKESCPSDCSKFCKSVHCASIETLVARCTRVTYRALFSDGVSEEACLEWAVSESSWQMSRTWAGSPVLIHRHRYKSQVWEWNSVGWPGSRSAGRAWLSAVCHQPIA